MQEEMKVGQLEKTTGIFIEYALNQVPDIIGHYMKECEELVGPYLSV